MFFARAACEKLKKDLALKRIGGIMENENEKGIEQPEPVNITNISNNKRSIGTKAGIAAARARGGWGGGRPRTCEMCGHSHKADQPHLLPYNEKGIARARRARIRREKAAAANVSIATDGAQKAAENTQIGNVSEKSGSCE